MRNRRLPLFRLTRCVAARSRSVSHPIWRDKRGVKRLASLAACSFWRHMEPSKFGFIKALAVMAPWIALASIADASACKPGNPDLSGHYVLNGAMEVGSQLLLLPDGQFEFMLAYGAIDQYGRGCWSVTDRTLTLRVQGRRSVPRQHSPADRRFRGMVLIVQPDGRLSWPLHGFRGQFERQ